MLGGVFNALLAPLAVRLACWEYPIAIVLAACLLRPTLAGAAVRSPDLAAAAAGLRSARCRSPLATLGLAGPRRGAGMLLLCVPAACRCTRLAARPAALRPRHGGGARGRAAGRRAGKSCVRAAQLLRRLHGQARSRRLPRPGPRHDDARRAERRSRAARASHSPTTTATDRSASLFARLGAPAARAVGARRPRRRHRRLLPPARPAWTFYEIDPLVERIARDPRYFPYLARLRARCRGRCWAMPACRCRRAPGSYDC